MAAGRWIWLGIVAAMLFAGPVHAQGKRVALVLGNSAYQNTPALTNPKNDADDVATALVAIGFDVTKGLDLDKAGIDRTIRSFAGKLTGADVGLFFYAGHGLQVGGVNYLVPVDAQLTTAAALDFEMVRLDLVQRTMESETKTNVIMLDACRDNPLSRNLARALGSRSATIGRGLAQAEAGVGTLISYSTQPGNVALDGTGRNSPYAGSLARHIKTAGEDLTSILIRVRNDVIDATASRQVPWDQHALRERLYLSGPPQPLQPVASEAAQAWAATQNSTSIAVLETFAKRHTGTLYADMAEARIRELRAVQTAMVTPPTKATETSAAGPPPASDLVSPPTKAPETPAAKSTPPQKPPPATSPYEGEWTVTWTNGAGCGGYQDGSYNIQIRGGRVSGGNSISSGRVSSSGAASWKHLNSRTSSLVSSSIQLSGKTGSGRWLNENGCGGTLTASRR